MVVFVICGQRKNAYLVAKCLNSYDECITYLNEIGRSQFGENFDIEKFPTTIYDYTSFATFDHSELDEVLFGDGGDGEIEIYKFNENNDISKYFDGWKVIYI